MEKWVNNFNIDITAMGDIGPAMAVAFSEGRYAVGVSIQEVSRKPDVTSWGRQPETEPRIVFYWAEPHKKERYRPLPKIDAATAAIMAKQWLDQVEYGPEPDHEGVNQKGWRIYNEIWGHVGGEWAAIVAISPRWAMFGK
jgi:hypothetical protein